MAETVRITTDWQRTDMDTPLFSRGPSAHDVRHATVEPPTLRRQDPGLPVLLLHDLARTPGDLASLLRAVREDEHAALVPDLAGCSLQPAQPLRADWLGDANEGFGALIAHGSGCALALAALHAGLTVARLVLIEPPAELRWPAGGFVPPPTLILRTCRGAARVDHANVRVVCVEPRSAGHVLADDPYVVATAVDFALHGRLPVF